MIAAPVAAELANKMFISANCKRSKFRIVSVPSSTDSPTATTYQHRRVRDRQRSIMRFVHNGVFRAIAVVHSSVDIGGCCGLIAKFLERWLAAQD